ncbi:Kinesin-4 [Hibiscus syriacus]|uniref:Kinesin-4 n=1 Tax=Hibiscus syriacus TaxID=106335 RepID=A0A6A3BS47_HIBSY|nr:Kinesin-4 [Hibiscus syriacus]
MTPQFYSKKRELVIEWINSILPGFNLTTEASDEELRARLIDGTVLCRILNTIKPNSLNEGGFLENSSVLQSENVKRFSAAMDEMGIPRFELSDLEKGSMKTVVNCLLALKIHSVSSVDDLSALKPSATVLQHDGHKFHDLFQLKQERYDELPVTDILEMMESNNLDNAPTQSLLNAVYGILDESVETKKDEMTHLVACLLRKLVQEIGRRLSTQADHLRSQNNLYRAREEKHQSRIRELEAALASATRHIPGSADKKYKKKEHFLVFNFIGLELLPSDSLAGIIVNLEMEEKRKLEKQEMMKLVKENENYIHEIAELKQQVEISGMMHKFGSREMEVQAKAAITVLQMRIKDLESLLADSRNKVKDIESLLSDSRNKVKDLESLLADSRNKVKDLEASFDSKCQSWSMKEKIYQSSIDFQLEAMQNLRSTSKAVKQEIMETKKSYSFEFNHLESKLKALADAAGNYHEVVAENRKLFNELQDLKGNIRVYCRIRPFLPGETGKQPVIENISEHGQLVIANPSRPGKDGQRLFKFNKVFGPNATQGDVFSDIQPFVRSVVDGYNVCIFAYGQTGSGKTYTMTGPNGATEEEWGINYQALNHLFRVSQSRRQHILYEVGVQMVEIYNEQVRDLLSIDVIVIFGFLNLHTVGITTIYQPNGLAVPDASMHPVLSTSDVLDLMDTGFKNRSVGATALNARSSRSHSIVTVHVRGNDLKTRAVLYGNLHLVDLAGSERVDRSEVTGDRLKEAQHINKSLSSLGDVIFALSKKSPHVPYRNSKLTQILQSSLGTSFIFILILQKPSPGSGVKKMCSNRSGNTNGSSDFFSIPRPVRITKLWVLLKFAERVSGVELGAARSSKEEKDKRELMEQIVSLKDTIVEKDEVINRLKSPKDVKPQIPQHHR